MTNKKESPELGEVFQDEPIGTELERKQEDVEENFGATEVVGEVKPEEMEPKPKKKRSKKSKEPTESQQQKASTQEIITIEEERTVQTEEDMAKADLLELQDAARTGRIMSGIIQGYEKTDKDFSPRFRLGAGSPSSVDNRP